MDKDGKIEIRLAVNEGKFAMSPRTQRKLKSAVLEGLGRLADQKLGVSRERTMEIPTADLETDLYKDTQNPGEEWVRNYWVRNGEQLPYCDWARQITEDLTFIQQIESKGLSRIHTKKDEVSCSYTGGNHLLCRFEESTVRTTDGEAYLCGRCKNVDKEMRFKI